VVEAALLADKRVSFAEIDADGFNVGLREVERLADEQSVLVATHQFGIPCEIRELMVISRSRGTLVIEDAAASFGSRIEGKVTGTFGDAAFYSFDSSKLVNVPLKGGAVTTKDADLFSRIKSLYGQESAVMSVRDKYRLLTLGMAYAMLTHPSSYSLFHKVNFGIPGRCTAETASLNWSPNSHYTMEFAEWQAFIAWRQVRDLDAIIRRRQQLYTEYLDLLAGLRRCQLPPEDLQGEWACARFPIRVRGDKLAYYRDAVRRGVDFGFSFTFIAAPPTFSTAHECAKAVLNVPFYANLSPAERDRVVEVLRATGDRRA
jgi:dTDP-4-amino-4,6-dideoxygalactose transaminase